MVLTGLKHFEWRIFYPGQHCQYPLMGVRFRRSPPTFALPGGTRHLPGTRSICC
jgi:hypothetical protein